MTYRHARKAAGRVSYIPPTPARAFARMDSAHYLDASAYCRNAAKRCEALGQPVSFWLRQCRVNLETAAERRAMARANGHYLP